MTDKKIKEQSKAPKRAREKVADIGKIVVAVLLLLLLLPAISIMWIKDSQKSPTYCASRHEEPYYTSWSDSSMHLLAEKHAQAGVSCTSCHGRSLSESNMEVVNYLTGNYYSPLPELEVSMDMCFTCHGDADTVALRTSTESSDLNLNPHLDHFGDLECSDCHHMHRASFDYCAECHGPTLEAEGWVTME